MPSFALRVIDDSIESQYIPLRNLLEIQEKFDVSDDVMGHIMGLLYESKKDSKLRRGRSIGITPRKRFKE